LIFCSNACAKSYYRGENSPNWKGGRKKHGEYVQLFVGKEHPLSDLHGYMMEHRAIMEKHLIDTNAEKYLVESKGKKYLNPLIKIHHKNHNKSDNRISNLVPMFSQKEHFHFNYCPHCEHCNKSGELLENPTRTISNQA
jgi:hypothetical protein